MIEHFQKRLVAKADELNVMISSHEQEVGIRAAAGKRSIEWHKAFTGKHQGKDSGHYRISRTQARHYLGLHGLADLADHVEIAIDGEPTIDLTGQTFGEWTALYPGDPKGRDYVARRWRCRCSCGHEEWKSAWQLRVSNAQTKACKECRILIGAAKFSEYSIEQRRLWRDIPGVRSAHWQRIVKGASIRNIRVEMDREQAWDLFIQQGQRCALTGRKLEMPRANGRKRRAVGTASLDRIDSKGHYTLDNVQWVHKDINRMKQIFNNEQFIQLCKEVARHHS